jgi:hypothetical protein
VDHPQGHVAGVPGGGVWAGGKARGVAGAWGAASRWRRGSRAHATPTARLAGWLNPTCRKKAGVFPPCEPWRRQQGGPHNRGHMLTQSVRAPRTPAGVGHRLPQPPDEVDRRGGEVGHDGAGAQQRVQHHTARGGAAEKDLLVGGVPRFRGRGVLSRRRSRLPNGSDSRRRR